MTAHHDRSCHADDLTAIVEDRSPRRARRDRSRDLQDGEIVVELADGADQTIGNRVFESQRVSDGDDGVAGVNGIAVTERQDRQFLGLDAHDHQIALTIAAPDLDHIVLAVIGECDRDLGVSGDHVKVARNESIAGHDESGSQRMIGAN